MQITRSEQTALLAWIQFRYAGKPVHELLEWRELDPPRDDTVYVVWKDSQAQLLYTMERHSR